MVGESDGLPAMEGDAARAELDRRGLSASLDAALESARYAARPASDAAGTYVVQNPAQGLRGVFAPDRAVITGDDAQVVMRPVGIGFGTAHQALTDGVVTAAGPRTEIARTVPGPSGAPVRVDEWWINRRTGIEQGFTVQAPPGERANGAWLTVAMALETELSPRLTPDETAVEFVDYAGTARLRYDHLLVVDATGRELPSRMRLDGATLRLEADDTEAVYPVTIDPTWTQQAYLKASNSGAGDHFGSSVAIAGNTVVVGAWQEDSSATGVNGDQASNATPNSGAAYVFVRDGVTWSQQAYLKASNANSHDWFGYSVAVAGDTIVVGAVLESSSATGVNGDPTSNASAYSGAAYVFVRDGVTWSQQAYLKASNTGAGDQFGWSVAVAADTIVVGARLEDSSATGVNGDQTSNTSADSGAAYVFVRDGATWSQQAYLKASNTGVNDGFGSSVALAGDTIVVGANGEDSTATGVNGTGNDGAFDAGAAYVFVRDGVTWSQQAYLKASNTGADDRFGFTVAVAGDTIVVGAYGEDSSATGVNGDQTSNTSADSGAAYVFVRAGVTWSQQAYLKASNTDALDQFGVAVAVAGDTIVVGAYGEDSIATGVNGDQANTSASTGAAYVFVRAGVTWSQQAYLKASNTGQSDEFGYSVAIAGDTVVVGARYESSSATGVNGDQASNAAVISGAVYVYLVSDLPPVADAGANQTVTATVATGAFVTLDGSASHDPENTALTYEWRDASNTVVGNTAVSGVTVPLGVHAYTLRVTNAGGVSATGTVTITVLAGTTTSIVCGTPVIYTGAAVTPCTATVLGVDGFSLSVSPSYENNMAAGTATASYMFEGDATHGWSFGTTTFAISARPVTARLTAIDKIYDGTATEPDANMSCTVTGQVPGDSLTCTATNGAFSAAAVGSGGATATVTLGGPSASNYTLGAVGTTVASQSIVATAGGSASTTAEAVYGQGGSFTLSGPVRLATDSLGGLYVAEMFNHRVTYFPAGSTVPTRVYGQLGSFTTNVANKNGISADSLNFPRAVWADANGVYIADANNARVLFYPGTSTTATRVYGQGGSFVTGVGNGVGLNANSIGEPMAVTTDASGNVYIADRGNRRVLFYAGTSTTASRVYGQFGSFTGYFGGGVNANTLTYPAGLALDSGDNLYVADLVDNRVLFYPAGTTTATRVYGQNGSFTTNTGGTSATTMRGPSGITIDAADNLYVPEVQNNRVLVFPAGSTAPTRVYGQGGSFVTSTSVPIGANSLSNPYGAAVTPDGKLFVADTTVNRVLRYSTQAGGTIITAPVTATLTAADKAYDGTTAAANAGLSCSLTGVIPSDAGDVACTATAGTFSSADVGARTVTATVTIGGTAAGNYTLGAAGTAVTSSTASAAAAITAATSTTVVICPASVTYTGSALESCTASVTGAGGLNEAVSVTYTNNTDAGTASATAHFAGNTNFDASSDTATFAITPAPLTATLLAAGKQYDKNPGAPNGILSCSVSGVLATDAGSITCTAWNGVFDSANAGARTVTAMVGISGAAASNYQLATSTATASSVITPRPVTATLTAADKTYDGTATEPDAAMSCAVTGVLSGDVVTCTPSNGAFNGTLAGSSAVTATVTLGGAASGNYTLGAAGTTQGSAIIGAAVSLTAQAVYGQLGSFTSGVQNNGGLGSGMMNPRSVATDSQGGLYVVESQNHRVTYFAAGSTTSSRVYGQLGSLTTAISNKNGVSADSLRFPRAVWVDGNDDVYIADGDNSRVLFYPAGTTTATRVYGQGGSFASAGGNSTGLNADSLAEPLAVTTDANGVYIADRGNRRVLFYQGTSTTATRVYGQGGSFTSLGFIGPNADSLVYPVGLAIDSTGGLYVSDVVEHRVLFYPAGSTTASRVYGQSSMVSTTPGTSATTLNGPVGLAVDASDNLYVADSQNNRVLFFPNGGTTATRVYGQGGSFTSAGFSGITANSLVLPQGVAVQGGMLFVADSQFSRVLRYSTQAGGTITTAPLTVTLTAADKAYDGTTAAADAGLSCVLTGVIPVDAADVACTATAGTFSSADAGARTVTATVTVSGTAAGNYTLGAGGTAVTSSTASAAAAIIAAASTTVVSCPASVTYTGSALESCTATVTGAGGLNEAVSVTYTNNTNAGTATATANYAGDVNHAASSDSVTFAITTAPVTVTLTAADKVYDGTTAAPNAGLSCSVSGLNPADAANVACTATAGSFDSLNVGTRTVTATVTLSGPSAGSYTLSTAGTSVFSATASAPAAITAAPLTVVGLTASNKTYNRTTTATFNAASAELIGLVAGDTVTVNTAAATGAFETATAGIGKTVTITGLTISGASAPNYTLSSGTATTTADILTKPVTVALGSFDKTYDGTNVAYGGQGITGVVAGDPVTVTRSNSTYDGVNAGPHVVTATLTLSGPGFENYTLGAAGTSVLSTVKTVASSILTKRITPTLTAANKPFDGTMAAADLACTLTGVIASDAGAVTCTPSGGAFDAATVGAHTVTATVTIGGSAVGNYTLGADGSAVLALTSTTTASILVTSSAVTITCPASVTYTGSALESCTATVTGAGGLNTTAAVTYTNNTDAGTASASATFAGDANREASTGSATFTIAKAASTTVVTCPASVPYTGSALESCTAAVTGAGGLNTTAAVTYTNNTDAGTASASATFAGDANREASTGSATFTIAKAASTTVVTCPASVTYTGAAVESCTATVTGAGGLNETATVTYTNNTAPGTATATASFAGGMNHSPSTDTKTFEVTNTAPTFIAPANITAEATSPAGAIVTYVAMGSDIEDGPVAAECVPVSGSMFPLGTTNVSCSVTDSAGATASGSFTVTVRDTTAPVITYTGNMGTYGVADSVNITCAATDAVGVVSTTCANVTGPATGFQLGTNTVTSTATDAAGNTRTATATFTVVATSAGLRQLITQIAGSSADQLLKALDNVVSAPNANARVGRVTAFRNQVNAQLKSGKITVQQATLLNSLIGAIK